MPKEKQLVPKLRFPEFEGEWEKKKLGNVAKVTSGGTPNRSKSHYWNGDIPWVTTSLIDFNIINYAEEFITEDGLNNSSAKLFPIGTLLMAMYGQGKTRGKIGLLGIQATTNQACGAIIPNEIINNQYLFQNLAGRYDEIRNLSNEGGQQNISGAIIKSLQLNFPSLPEQQKIAQFLTAIDTRIQNLEKKKTLLEQYKKGVMQKIFKRELRFKDDDGKEFPKWQRLQLLELADRVLTKNKIDNQNVLTISAQLGLVSQLEYFNKSVSAKNLKGYYLLEKNDFAYNKSYSNGYPMGAIKRLDKYDLGVVSTLYICFRFNSKVSLDFMEQYFDAGLQNREIEKVAQEGARNHGLLNIGVNDFFEIDLKIPSIAEQTKIANFLSAIDKKIELMNNKIDLTKTYKKGLLQQMFV